MPQANCSPAVLACVGVDGGQLLLAALNWAAGLFVHPCVVAGVTARLLVPVKDDIWVICGFELNTLQQKATDSSRCCHCAEAVSMDAGMPILVLSLG